MNRSIAYLKLLRHEIQDDLAGQIDSDKLQDEVEKTLKKQVLSGLVKSISEVNDSYTYSNDKTKRVMTERTMFRQIDYVRELFQSSDEVKGAITSGATLEEIEA